jgi:hypothetical protein
LWVYLTGAYETENGIVKDDSTWAISQAIIPNTSKVYIPEIVLNTNMYNKFQYQQTEWDDAVDYSSEELYISGAKGWTVKNGGSKS